MTERSIKEILVELDAAIKKLASSTNTMFEVLGDLPAIVGSQLHVKPKLKLKLKFPTEKEPTDDSFVGLVLNHEERKKRIKGHQRRVAYTVLEEADGTPMSAVQVRKRMLELDPYLPIKTKSSHIGSRLNDLVGYGLVLALIDKEKYSKKPQTYVVSDTAKVIVEVVNIFKKNFDKVDASDSLH